MTYYPTRVKRLWQPGTYASVFGTVYYYLWSHTLREVYSGRVLPREESLRLIKAYENCEDEDDQCYVV